jgi:hemoglobin-like flavoprotein
MTLDINNLEKSFDMIAPRGAEVVDDAYARIFAVAPALRELFPVDMTRHKRSVLAILILVRRSLRDVDRLMAKLRALGARHVAYRARPEHYDVAVAALVDAMAFVAGDEWTLEYQRAWTAALKAVTEAMIQGAEQAMLGEAA